MTMKKNLIILIAVAILGGGAFYLYQLSATSNQADEINQEAEVPSENSDRRMAAPQSKAHHKHLSGLPENSKR